VAELRSAFAAMLQDGDFRAELTALQIGLEPLAGEALQDFILKSFEYDPDLIAKAEALARPD
jgi:hypothetical protein